MPDRSGCFIDPVQNSKTVDEATMLAWFKRLAVMQRCERGVSSTSVRIKTVCYTFKCIRVSVQNVRHQ